MGSNVYLSHHTFACEVDGAAVLLNAKAGEYIGIEAADLADLRAQVVGWGPTELQCTLELPRCSELIERLMSRSFLTENPLDGKPYQKVDLPAISAIPQTISGMRRSRMTQLRAVGAIRTAARCLRTGRLYPLLRRLQLASNGRTAMADLRRAVEVSQSFFATRLWLYTTRGNCLRDSVALRCLLECERVPSTLLIGVSTKPFLAHAWVQADGVVLNDAAEYVRLFTPLLAI